jgi:leucyl aminopeptidase
MEFSTKSLAPEAAPGDCLVVGISEDLGMGAGATRIDRASRGAVRAAMRSGDMAGRRGSVVVLRGLAGVASARVALVGLGKSGDFHEKALGEVVAAAVKGCGAGVKRIVFAAADWKVQGLDAAGVARAAVVAARAALWRSDELQTEAGSPGKAANARTLRVTWLVPARERGAARAAQYGQALANGIEFAKRLGNLPGNICTPDFLAGEARKMARAWGLQCQVMGERQIEALKMGSFLSVTRGSEQPPRLIVLRYHGRKDRAFAAPVALVGKGITFDSGGISLKPGAAMDEMKFDMCGAAAVLGTMRAIAELKPRINVVAVVPSCENLPSGRASKPGDIVRTMSGQTVEILNTDAEGRLILCDALTYVQRFRPDSIVDVATLTGACVVALGNVHSGLFSRDEPLAKELLDAGRLAGDSAWRMPVDDDYQEQLKSNFADIANIGLPGNAGATTAACFLSRFVKGQRWAHLDIAGTAWKSGAATGATGRPVGLLTAFLMARAQAQGR